MSLQVNSAYFEAGGTDCEALTVMPWKEYGNQDIRIWPFYVAALLYCG